MVIIIRHFLVDSENVNDNWLMLFDMADEDDEIIVFYTKKSPHMSYMSVIRLMENNKINIRFEESYEGTNALDFQLVSYMGYLMGCAGSFSENKCDAASAESCADEYIIMSNDTGYDPAKIYVFEAPIDLLSHGALMQLSMRKQCSAIGQGDKYRPDCWLGVNRVSLSGCSDIALKQRLSDDPRITQIVFCLDNDETGQQATEKLMNKYSQQYTVSVSIPPYGKDWNDTLKAVVSAHSKLTDKTKTEE